MLWVDAAGIRDGKRIDKWSIKEAQLNQIVNKSVILTSFNA